MRSGLLVAVAAVGIIGAGWAAPAAAQGACTGGGKISKQIAKSSPEEVTGLITGAIEQV